MSAARPPAADRLITAESGSDGGRVYQVVAGVKRWIVSPDAFVAHGWRFADVELLSDAEIEAIPTSPVVVGVDPPVAERDGARLRTSAAFLHGRGIELGAGMSPQPLPADVACELFDLREPEEIARLEGLTRGDGLRTEDVPRSRSIDEIARRFPDGADFVIAHNVLEHCAEPIGTVHAWSAHLRPGGVLVLSVPDVDHCPDAGRLVPDLEHLLADHLLGRDGDSFESREHAYSCAVGWMTFWED